MAEYEIFNELLDICKYFKTKVSVNTNYMEYISALLYLQYYKKNSGFERIYQERENYYITEYIDEALTKMRYELNLPQLFADINFRNTIMYRNIGEKSPFKKIIEMLYKLEKKNEAMNKNSKSLIALAYEYILEEAVKNYDIPTEKEFYTPKSITDVMARLIGDDASVLFDGFCGSGNFFISANNEKKVDVLGLENNSSIYNICMTNLFLHDIDNNKVFLNQGQLEKKMWKFDAILTNIPFSQKDWVKDISYEDRRFVDAFGLPSSAVGDYAYVLSMFNHLSDNGTMAVVLPHGVLFRKNEQYTRKKLFPYIKAIIGLPENLFYANRIAVIILVLSKKTNNGTILYVDASNEFINGRKNNKILKETQQKIVDVYNNNKEVKDFSRLVNLEEIESNDFNLTIKRYFKKSENPTIVKKKTILEELKSLEEEKSIIEGNINDVLKALNVLEYYKNFSDGSSLRQNLAKNLKKIRSDKGYTQKQFADFLNITKGFYVLIECCKTDVNIGIVELLCNKLEVSVIELLAS